MPLARLLGIIGLVSALFVAGCASGPPRVPVPAQLADLATIDGFQDIRLWEDASPANLDKLVATAIDQRAEQAIPQEQDRQRFLAISGGGSDGAFGAGLLVGWTANSTRPAFDVVTGVSTGAPIAPFAFLGPRYDTQLREFYTRYSSSDLLTPQVLSGLLGGTALSDSTPFKALIAKYITPELLEEIAREHRQGRRLFVGTTNLDAQRPVIWDMGAIAASGRRDAPELFRSILLASASIPVAFPPVHIKVRVDGKIYDELHVDGGITAQVFFLPSQIMLRTIDRRFGLTTKRELYVIRNGHIGATYQAVDNKLSAIADRAIATVVKSQSAGELLSLYLTAQRDGVDYRLAYIPTTFDAVSAETFDREYMKALFQVGYDLARKGYNWEPSPPLLRD